MTDQYKVLPVFTSHNSIGRSILTMEEKFDPTKGLSGDEKGDKTKWKVQRGPRSIIDICAENKFKKCILIEDRFMGFVDAERNLTSIGCELIFGIRFTCCENIADKSEASLETQHRIIVMYKNAAGLSKLRKLYSKAYIDGFYYVPRIDLKEIEKVWSDEDLLLVIPFYDSFLHVNSLEFRNVIPSLGFTKPIFFRQKSGLPIDKIIDSALTQYTNSLGLKVFDSKNIYYEKRSDFLAYMTYRCIFNQTTMDKPNMDDFASPEFSFESWKEENNS
jgi:DNA polymerase III alpha subunit